MSSSPRIWKLKALFFFFLLGACDVNVRLLKAQILPQTTLVFIADFHYQNPSVELYYDLIQDAALNV